MRSLSITLYYWIDDGSDECCGEVEFAKGSFKRENPDDDVVFIRRYFYADYMISDEEDDEDESNRQKLTSAEIAAILKNF